MILAILEFLGSIASKVLGSAITDWVKKKWPSKSKKDDKPDVDTEPVIDPNFCYRYEPGRISIEKIIQTFGAADTKTDYDQDDYGETIVSYKYFFGNAKVLFTTYLNKSDIISVTVFSKMDDENPVYCRMSEAEDYIPLGQAVISDYIIEDTCEIEQVSTGRGRATNIIARYGHANIRYLTFIYQVEAILEDVNDAKDKTILQVCVTQNSFVRPMFSFDETFYY